MNVYCAKRSLIFIVASIVLFSSDLHSQRIDYSDSVRIIRDQWGVPHIISDDENALFYGAGYAAAEDRLFQMCLCRYSVQGRLAEIFGRNYLQSDRKTRTVGYYRHAARSLPQLDSEVQDYLQAYADGVNAYMRDNPRHMTELFEEYCGPPEPWKPEDCVACMLRIAERFDGGWTKEVNALRNFEELERNLGREEAIRQLEAQKQNIDDDVAIVSKEEYEDYPLCVKRDDKPVNKTQSQKVKYGTDDSPKMSHDWVVSGAKSVTGLPILESDPQIAVEFPATWYEFHLHGGKFNVRGIGMPGVPAMLLGFSENCAWGLTALGSDNADLFQEQFVTGSDTEYKIGEEIYTVDEREETIKVKGERDQTLTIRSTIHGPIVNDFVSGKVNEGEVFALSYIMTQSVATEIPGMLKMMIASNWQEFVDGMSDYRSPGVHLIYADKDNNIAYYTLARLPLRAHNAGIPFQGWTGEEEWLGIIPFDEMPRMLNPECGYISTANNLPIGSWYQYHVGGGIGDNARSWRLRELMESKEKFSPEDFLYDVHQDAINPIVRDFVKFALMAVEEENPMDRDILAAVDSLEDWDYKLLTSFPSYRMVRQIGTWIKRTLRGTPMEDDYLGSDAGLAQLFRDLQKYYDTTGQLIDDPDIRAWLLEQLKRVYVESGLSAGGRPYQEKHEMKYQNNLEGFGSLARANDVLSPPLYCGVTATIWSQKGNSYSQIVNFANIDSSLSILPPGNSEVPDDPHATDLIDMWVDGGMHLAPLSLGAIENIRESEYVLRPNLSNIEDIPEKLNPEIYPNPAHSHVFIRLSTSSESCSISIEDLLGSELIRFGEIYTSDGSVFFTWDCLDRKGNSLPAGVYVVKVTCGQNITNRLLILQ